MKKLFSITLMLLASVLFSQMILESKVYRLEYENGSNVHEPDEDMHYTFVINKDTFQFGEKAKYEIIDMFFKEVEDINFMFYEMERVDDKYQTIQLAISLTHRFGLMKLVEPGVIIYFTF